MDVRIGVVNAPREISLEMDGTPEEIEVVVRKAVEESDTFVWLSDRRGNRVVVPRDKLAYVEIEGQEGPKHIGFAG